MGSISRRSLLALTAVPGSGSQTSDVQGQLRRELSKSAPDYTDGSTHDGLNEHFLVFDGPDGSMMAVWTQSDIASGLPNTGQKNRIMFSRSTDEGVTWQKPLHIAGPASHQAPDGKMAGIYSDDNGRTWSKGQFIEMPTSPYDDPEGKIPAEWIVWQIPMRDLSGGFLVGYTHWFNPARCRMKKVEAWTQHESAVEFMRFTNVDSHPEPRDLKVKYSAWGDKALRAPYYRDPLMTFAQEPSIVRLPDKRLFCAMRSNSGDFGLPILQPVSCCPIYRLADGRFVLLHHNNRGGYAKKPEGSWGPRRPAFIALAEFRPKADQPLWFSESKQLMDNGDVGVNGDPNSKQKNIGVYSSFGIPRRFEGAGPLGGLIHESQTILSIRGAGSRPPRLHARAGAALFRKAPPAVPLHSEKRLDQRSERFGLL